uniref:UvrD-helicase domain-containing protein n=1 Tax=Ezakiella massiliensis TaxID=1852374 RepID=UPI00094E319C|nr:UvrD-helicase domain-containing protein [Ezakiella massiliensis]
MIKLDDKQRLAVNTIDQNVLVKAGAGAGKTAVLTERFINLVNKAVTTEEKEAILAITFTNKAVEEMKSRIVSRLNESGADTDFQLNIFTFDAFFKKLVEEYLPDKYIGFDLMDENKIYITLKEIIEDLLEYDQKYMDLIVTLQELNDSYDMSAIVDDLVYLYINSRNIYGDLDYRKLKSPSSSKPKLTYGKLYDLSREYYSRKNKLWTYLDEHFLEVGDDYVLTIEDLIDLTKLGLLKTEILYEIQASSVDLDDDYSEIYALTKELLYDINQKFQARKRELYLFDFTDITVDAIILLKEYLQVLQGRYKYVMIDEFQDTSPLQMKFFDILTNNFTVNNIFVVGDIKQSIYRFRGADYKNINKFENEILKRGGLVIELDTNYRSSKGIVQFVNKSFSDVLPEYSDMIYDKDNPSEIMYFDKEKFSTKSLSDIVNQLISDGYSYKDIGILTSTANKAYEIEKMLSLAGIPYINYNKLSLGQRPEVIEAIILINLFIDSQNKFNVFSALRGVLFDLSDKVLSKLDINFDFNNYSGHLKEVNNSIKIFKNLEYYFFSHSITEFLDYLYIEKDFLAKCKKIWGIDAINNLIEFKNYLQKTVENEQKHLKYAIIELQSNNELRSVDFYSDSENAIKISTIHKAKGLQYKVIILPNLSDRSSQKFSRFLISDQTLYIKLSDILGSYQLVKRQEAADLDAEKNRLLYVAITRAKDRIICLTNEKIYNTAMLAPIFDTYQNHAREFEIKDQNSIFSEFKIIENIQEKVKIGIEEKSIKPSQAEDNVFADIEFGNFIHHFAEIYQENKNINVNELIDLYNIAEIYDYEKINRHLNNISYFIDSRDGDVYCEKNISMDIDEKHIDAVIDRLEIKDNEIFIVDYKTVEISQDISFYNEIYKDQLIAYRDIISKIYKDKIIKTFIFYTSIGRLEEILL